MDEKLGLTRIMVTHIRREEVIVLSGVQADGSTVTVARVDDDMPAMATHVLLMLKRRGLVAEGELPDAGHDEPAVRLVSLRTSIDDDGEEWTDLETRFVDGQKFAAVRFAPGFAPFARAAAAMFD